MCPILFGEIMIIDMKQYMKGYREKNKKRIAGLSKIRCSRWIKKHKEETKEYMKEYHNRYYQQNKEKIKNYMEKWKENNPEKYLEGKKIYRQNNKEKIVESNKAYRANNKEKIFEAKRKWREENPEYGKNHYKKNKKRYFENNKLWCKNNRKRSSEIASNYFKTEKGKANHQRAKYKRRARMKNIINTLTAKEWLDILKKYDYRCAYCGIKFDENNIPEKDHVIPVSKGGDNIKENIVPACRSCNAKKSNKIRRN